MTTEQATPPKPKRSRSPSYPAIDLGEALKRAQKFYDAEREHPANVDTILAHWGYEPKSGNGLVILAALKKFGLLVEDGKGSARRGRLSRAALEILLDDREDSSERERLIQKAALKPTIHGELWREYSGSLPSDRNLKHHLRLDLGFTDRGVTEFIPQFRRTLAFANLIGGGKLSTEDGDSDKPEGDALMTPPTTLTPTETPPDTQQPAKLVVQLPIAPAEFAALQAPFPLTEAKGEQMLAVLNAMKPALVGSGGEQRPAEEPE